MRHFVFSIIVLFFFGMTLSFGQVAPPAVIFSGKYGKILPSDGLKFKDDTLVIAGSIDPTVTAYDAPAGSIYLSSSTGKTYQKQDAGSSTNWSVLYFTPTFSADNRVLRSNGTDDIQDSGVTIDDVDNITGVVDLTASGSLSGADLTINSTQLVNAVSIDDTLSADSDTTLPSQSAVKGYVDGLDAGNVKGPVSSTDSALSRWDGVTGRLVQDSGVLLNDLNNITGVNDLTVDGQLVLGPNSVNVLDQLKYNGGTGLVSGGTCSINGVDNSKFDISAGVGIKVNGTLVPVTWSAFSAQTVTNLATAEVSYIYINETGAIVQQTTEPTPASRRNDIFLCRLVHPDNTTIVAAGNRPDISIDLGNQFGDLVRALGLIRVSGLGVSPATLLQFNTAAGTIFNIGSNFANNNEDPHYIDTAAKTPTSFTYVTQASGSSAAATSIDPTQYDNAGVLTAIGGSPNSATIQRVFIFPSGQIYVQYGQTVYPSLADALAGIGGSTFIPNPNILGEALAIGAWVVTRSCTDLNTTSCARFVTTSKLGDFPTSGSGAVVTLQNAYNASTAGTITLDSTRGAVKIADAATPTGGNLFTVASNALSTIYFRVTATLADFFNLRISGNEISSTNTDGDIDLNPNGSGIVRKIDANGNAATVGSNNPELANKMEYPSFEEGISSQVTCTGCTGGALTQVASNAHGSWAGQAAFAGVTGTIDIVVPATELANMETEVSCRVTTPATATNVWFVSQRNGADTGWEVQIPAGVTTRLVGIPLANGGSTSTGMQIDIRTAITGNIDIDDCSVGTFHRANDFSQVTGSELVLYAHTGDSGTLTAATTPVKYVTEVLDKYDSFSSGVFTAPEAGVYTFNATILTTGGAARFDFYINGSIYKAGESKLSSESDFTANMTTELNAGDTVDIRCSTSATQSNVGSGSYRNVLLVTKTKTINTITLGPDNFTGLTKGAAYTIPSSAGFGTIDTANTDLEYRRVADKLVIDGFITPGTTTGVTANIGLPTGFTIRDPSPRVGGYWFTSASANNHGGAVLLTPGTSYIEFSTNGVFGGDVVSPTTAANGDQVVGTGVKFHIHVEIPIEGWDQGAAVVEIDPCQTKSTSETACAQWWVDGSRIYQRCAEDSTPRTTDFTIGTFATGLAVKSIEGTWYNGVDTYPLNMTAAGSNTNRVWAKYVRSTGAVTVVNTDWNPVEVVVCLKYTK